MGSSLWPFKNHKHDRVTCDIWFSTMPDPLDKTEDCNQAVVLPNLRCSSLCPQDHKGVPSVETSNVRACSVLSDLNLCDPMDPPIRLLCLWIFSRQEYWPGLPFPTLGDLPTQVSCICCICRQTLDQCHYMGNLSLFRGESTWWQLGGEGWSREGFVKWGL